MPQVAPTEHPACLRSPSCLGNLGLPAIGERAKHCLLEVKGVLDEQNRPWFPLAVLLLAQPFLLQASAQSGRPSEVLLAVGQRRCMLDAALNGPRVLKPS